MKIADQLIPSTAAKSAPYASRRLWRRGGAGTVPPKVSSVEEESEEDGKRYRSSVAHASHVPLTQLFHFKFEVEKNRVF